MKLLLPLLAVLGGVAIAAQGQINGGLGKKVGVLEASFISFSIGTVALFIVMLFWGKGDVTGVLSVPKWQLLGGILGAFFVAMSVFVVPKLGVATTFMAVVVGQIVIGALIDHFGLFGGHRVSINPTKILAIVLLFVALFLYQRN